MLDWRTAYLLQAKSEYDILQKLRNLPGVAECHRLHYLQMVTEKLARGLQTVPKDSPPQRTHKAFVDFVRSAKTRPDLQRACGFEDRRQYKAYIQSLLPSAKAIESLSPEGDDHPNPEYPREVGGVVHSPLEYPFTDVALSNPKMLKLQQFVDICFELA